jgi:hypothetical protein
MVSGDRGGPPAEDTDFAAGVTKDDYLDDDRGPPLSTSAIDGGFGRWSLPVTVAKPVCPLLDRENEPRFLLKLFRLISGSRIRSRDAPRAALSSRFVARLCRPT